MNQFSDCNFSISNLSKLLGYLKRNRKYKIVNKFLYKKSLMLMLVIKIFKKYYLVIQ